MSYYVKLTALSIKEISSSDGTIPKFTSIPIPMPIPIKCSISIPILDSDSRFRFSIPVIIFLVLDSCILEQQRNDKSKT